MMYGCLTAQEETRLFLEEMDALENEGELTTTNSSNDGKVFTEGQVKNNEDTNDVIFFIAGRGGETNFHYGNKIFRERVLKHTLAYINVGAKGRGKAFTRYLIQDHAITDGICFVIRQAYFAKNVKAGNISAKRKNSVLTEHAPRTLEEILAHVDEESTHYMTIGQDWIIGIITDMLRTAAAKYTSQNNTSTKRILPCPEIIIPEMRKPHDNEDPRSVASAISDDGDDESSLHSHSTGSTGSASNDMFLSFSIEVPPCKKAKSMTMSTTLCTSTDVGEGVPAPTSAAEDLTAPFLDRQSSLQSWDMSSISSINIEEAGELLDIWNTQDV